MAPMLMSTRVRQRQVCAYGCCDPAHAKRASTRKSIRRATKRSERNAWKQEVVVSRFENAVVSD
jgi:hypothetical protein